MIIIFIHAYYVQNGIEIISVSNRIQEEFEDTKEVIRSSISKKNGRYNGQEKKIQNVKQ